MDIFYGRCRLWIAGQQDSIVKEGARIYVRGWSMEKII